MKWSKEKVVQCFTENKLPSELEGGKKPFQPIRTVIDVLRNKGAK